MRNKTTVAVRIKPVHEWPLFEGIPHVMLVCNQMRIHGATAAGWNSKRNKKMCSDTK